MNILISYLIKISPCNVKLHPPAKFHVCSPHQFRNNVPDRQKNTVAFQYILSTVCVLLVPKVALFKLQCSIPYEYEYMYVCMYIVLGGLKISGGGGGGGVRLLISHCISHVFYSRVLRINPALRPWQPSALV